METTMNNTTPKTKGKLGRMVLITVLTLVLIAGAAFLYYLLCMNPTRGTVQGFQPTQGLTETLTRRQAEQDLAYLIKQMKTRHPAWVDGSHEKTKAVMAQYHTELDALNDENTVLALWQAAGRIAARLGDGHTNVWTKTEGENLTINDLTQLAEYGAPVAVNGVPTDELYEVFLTQFPYEIKAYAKSSFERLLVRKQYLAFCGAEVSDGVTFTFDTGTGQSDYHYTFVPESEAKTTEPPQSDEWVYYSIDKEQDTAVFTLTECVCNDEYLNTLDAFFNEVHENGITNVIVDLRGNGGGNSWVANEFLRYIDVERYESWDCDVRMGWYVAKNRNISYENNRHARVFDGNLYVLTDLHSYSAAMDFAMLIADNGLGTLVGEASGNLPASYGDCLYFQTPNARLCMGVSFKKWYRVDKSKNDEPLTPDYECPPEQALQKAYELIAAT